MPGNHQSGATMPSIRPMGRRRWAMLCAPLQRAGQARAGSAAGLHTPKDGARGTLSGDWAPAVVGWQYQPPAVLLQRVAISAPGRGAGVHLE